MEATLNETHALLRNRRSTRQFTGRSVPVGLLNQILETGTRAPSAHNRQPWRFAVVTDIQAKAGLAAAMGERFRRDLQIDGEQRTDIDRRVKKSAERILKAPVVVILCSCMEDMDIYLDPKRQAFEHLMAAQSVALAGGNILNAASLEGLGGVWICAPLFAQEAVRQALQLPAEWEPQGMLLLGYPDGNIEMRARKALEDVVIFR